VEDKIFSQSIMAPSKLTILSFIALTLLVRPHIM